MSADDQNQTTEQLSSDLDSTVETLAKTLDQLSTEVVRLADEQPSLVHLRELLVSYEAALDDFLTAVFAAQTYLDTANK